MRGLRCWPAREVLTPKSAPRAASSDATRNVCVFVFEKRKQPVSVISPTYRACAATPSTLPGHAVVSSSYVSIVVEA